MVFYLSNTIFLRKKKVLYSWDCIADVWKLQVQKYGFGNSPVEEANGEIESAERDEQEWSRSHAFKNGNEEQCH